MRLLKQPNVTGSQHVGGGEFLSKPLVLCLLLAVMTMAVFQPATHCGFINYDDPEYFSAQPRVQVGLSVAGVGWALTTGHFGNWHPLTWISLMLDAEVFGKNPFGPHFTNIVFHAANTALLFLALRALTRAIWRSAMVAGLFALHPLHVESVAWISERKDVLSTFFGLLALLCYANHAGRAKIPLASLRSGAASEIQGNGFYVASLVFFALGLMSKSMLVTLPCALLLLDWWPLNRLRLSNWREMVMEKIPFLALALAVSAITFSVQQQSGAMNALPGLPLSARVENIFVSYARYLGKTFWPESLAVPYPHPGHWPVSVVCFSAVLFAGLCVAAVVAARRFPYFFTGWFWFAGTLVPVIGLVQIGEAAMADRYTYLPHIGLFIALVWAAAGIFRAWRWPPSAMIFAALIVLALAGWWTREQLKFWTDSGALFRHTLAVTKNNSTAENQLGIWYSANGQIPEAMACFQRALQINPENPLAFKNLGDSFTREGLALTRQGQWDQAIDKYHHALSLDPKNAAALYNLGNAYARLEQWDQAIHFYREALRADPAQADVLNNLGFALVVQHQIPEAFACYEAALRVNPNSAETHNNYGTLLFRQGNFGGAAQHFLTAAQLEPEQPQFCANLGDALGKLGKLPEAIQCYQQALQLDPANPKYKAKLQAIGEPSKN